MSKKLFPVLKDSPLIFLLRFDQLKEQYERALSRNEEELNKVNFRLSIFLKNSENRNKFL